MDELLRTPLASGIGEATPLLAVRNLVKDYRVGGKGGELHRAVDDVSFDVREGEILGLVGESGSGKSTTARCILRLVEPTSGEVRLAGASVGEMKGRSLFDFRRSAQMVFQDPYSSVNPLLTIEKIVGEGIDIHELASDKDDRRRRIVEALQYVGLGEEVLPRLPSSFSGGQRQRIGIARALAVGPRVLLCDEPVASLDVSIRAQILNLFSDLRERLGLAMLFIAHDLASVRHLCDRVAVMLDGRIVEEGTCDEVYDDPQHEFTRHLLRASPIPDPIVERERMRLLSTTEFDFVDEELGTSIDNTQSRLE